MLPLDSNYIFEMIFYVNGFKESKLLSRKLVQLHQLCTVQLSHAEHYDFNIRTMKTILFQAKYFKRNYPNLNESQIIFDAIWKVNAPKLIETDLKIFNELCKQIFPQIENVSTTTLNGASDDNGSIVLMEFIVKCLKKRNLQPTQFIIEKIVQIYQMIEMNAGIIIIGDTLTGKSTAWQILADTLREIKSNGIDTIIEYDVLYRIINPKSISLKQLFGHIDSITLEWCEGVLAKIFREMVNLTGTQQTRGWIIFDGIVDPIWAETLHTLLDDNRKLCLASGEMIEKTALMSIFFETDNLEFSSPATIARCGIIYMRQCNEQWKNLHLCFIDVLKSFELIDIYITLFEALVDWLIPAVLHILRECNGILMISSMQQYKVC